jgi:DNA polymerase III subunit epsilon
LPAWFNRLPDRFVLLDVETTGIHSSDRIVTLAAISVEWTALFEESMTINYMHLIFDPS